MKTILTGFPKTALQTVPSSRPHLRVKNHWDPLNLSCTHSKGDSGFTDSPKPTDSEGDGGRDLELCPSTKGDKVAFHPPNYSDSMSDLRIFSVDKALYRLYPLYALGHWTTLPAAFGEHRATDTNATLH